MLITRHCALLAPIALAFPCFAQPTQSVDALYATTCAKCHGDRAQGGGAGTSSLLRDDLRSHADAFDTDRRFFDAIKNGLPDRGMEAFGQTLKDEQVWGLVVYIRELQEQDRRKSVGSPIPPRSAKGQGKSQRAGFTIETIIDKGVDTPWSVDWLPSGEMLVTERPGSLRIFRSGTLSRPVDGLPKVTARGQGGLMDVAVHPNYAKPGNGWVYLAYTHASDDGKREMTRIVRGRLDLKADPPRWTNESVIFEARPEHLLGPGVHYGSRIVFDPKDPTTLFFSIGERGSMDMAQDVTRPNGKVHRVKDDGAIPRDNPFVGRKNAYESIWSYGHRNPQGLAFDLAADLWDTEHGPRGGDELNRIERGANYGWPIVSFGINYSGAPFRLPWARDNKAPDGKPITMPIDRWLPSIGACGLDVARGPAFPAWKGDLFAGGLSGQNVDRIRVKDGKVLEHEEIIYGLGRVRDVVCAPDGTICVVLNGPDKVIRLKPAE